MTHVWPEPITLAGRLVLLEPLEAGHADRLAEAAADGDMSRLWYTSVPAPEDVPAAIEDRLRRRDAGEWLPFATLDKETGRGLGMTGYLNLVEKAPRLEIGGTWLRRSAQGAGYNGEAKLLLLSHAFEVLGCTAVEFRTNRFNAQSRRAIEALGAQLDGILRNHFDAFGHPRDTCVYSIIAPEWPQVRRHLKWRLTSAIDRMERPPPDLRRERT